MRSTAQRRPTVKAPNPAKYPDERFGLPRVQEILKELEKPGMRLEGMVTKVTNFGDIGVHQNGLVHVSAVADRFVRAPYIAGARVTAFARLNCSPAREATRAGMAVSQRSAWRHHVAVCTPRTAASVSVPASDR